VPVVKTIKTTQNGCDSVSVCRRVSTMREKYPQENCNSTALSAALLRGKVFVLLSVYTKTVNHE
jgi:hypothetical protein